MGLLERLVGGVPPDVGEPVGAGFGKRAFRGHQKIEHLPRQILPDVPHGRIVVAVHVLVGIRAQVEELSVGLARIVDQLPVRGPNGLLVEVLGKGELPDRFGFTLQDRAKKNGKIEFIWDAVVDRINGEEKVTSLDLKNVKTGETWTHETDGVFIAIGHIPNSDLFKGQLEIDEQGYLITDKYHRTKVEGVWAAGEIADPVFRQAITSAGMGAAAAIAAERWLSEHEDEVVTDAITA